MFPILDDNELTRYIKDRQIKVDRYFDEKISRLDKKETEINNSIYGIKNSLGNQIEKNKSELYMYINELENQRSNPHLVVLFWVFVFAFFIFIYLQAPLFVEKKGILFEILRWIFLGVDDFFNFIDSFF